MSLNNKIDFAIIFKVKNANPNGDPLNGNRPRVDYGNYGEVSDVCLKRKTNFSKKECFLFLLCFSCFFECIRPSVLP